MAYLKHGQRVLYAEKHSPDRINLGKFEGTLDDKDRTYYIFYHYDDFAGAGHYVLEEQLIILDDEVSNLLYDTADH